MNEDKEARDARLKEATKYDKHENINFRCSIGKTEATICVLIEPDPHGDDSGTHSHFHASLLCPKTKIVDLPEPDRCKITDET